MIGEIAAATQAVIAISLLAAGGLGFYVRSIVGRERERATGAESALGRSVDGLREEIAILRGRVERIEDVTSEVHALTEGVRELRQDIREMRRELRESLK